MYKKFDSNKKHTYYMSSNMGCIYVIVNKVTNKKYVGQTIKSAEKRMKQHFLEARGGTCGSRILNRAINKYGNSNFELSVIVDNVYDREQLDLLETKYIVEFNTLAPNGYNIQTGGQSLGRKHCDESRELMRQKKLGANNHNFGKPRTDEAKDNIRQSKLGEKHHFYGKELSNEHKEKLSQAHKKYDSTLPMYIAYNKARPEHYSSEGYIVINPLTKKKTYFTSKKLTMQQKLDQAQALLQSLQL